MAIPLPVRRELSKDNFMETCVHQAFFKKPTPCAGRIEFEHAMSGMGRNIQKKWSILPVCTFHHRGAGLIKGFNVYIALSRASDEELKLHSKAENLIQRRIGYKIEFAPRMNSNIIPKA